jgi:hypothetical protein
MHILQRVWTPWLEGVAAFLELASDPSEGDVSSLIGEVLANLVDAYVSEAGSGINVEALMKSRAETERLYTDLLATSARPRLRHYLGTRWWKYGPGYLAVRAVVDALRHARRGPRPWTRCSPVSSRGGVGDGRVGASRRADVSRPPRVRSGARW